mgnify:CR=1 FL=1
MAKEEFGYRCDDALENEYKKQIICVYLNK